MTAWTDYQLDALSGAIEIHLKPRKDNKSLGAATNLWVVAVGNDLYVRAVEGRDSKWFEQALHNNSGRVTGAGVEEDVVFEQPDDSLRNEIDAAYRLKYARYPDEYLGPVLTEEAAAATLRLVQADDDE